MERETEKIGQHLSELWGGADKQSLLEFFIALAKDSSGAIDTKVTIWYIY
jgi:hypothetical protein